jgi:hypothetical protein
MAVRGLICRKIFRIFVPNSFMEFSNEQQLSNIIQKFGASPIAEF